MSINDLEVNNYFLYKLFDREFYIAQKINELEFRDIERISIQSNPFRQNIFPLSDFIEHNEDYELLGLTNTINPTEIIEQYPEYFI